MPTSIRAAALLCLTPFLAVWLTAAQPTLAQAADALVLDKAERKTLAAVEDYLNGIQTLKAEFTQVGPDGEPAEGVIYMRRPGLLRVEYKPPVPVIIVGDGFLIHYHDKELGQIDDWFIYDTPLGALTKEDMRFDEDVDVTGFLERDGRIAIRVVQEDDPTGGSLTLYLDADPMRLTHWRISDAQGHATTVTLYKLRTNMRLSRRLFVFDDPRRKRNQR